MSSKHWTIFHMANEIYVRFYPYMVIAIENIVCEIMAGDELKVLAIALDVCQILCIGCMLCCVLFCFKFIIYVFPDVNTSTTLAPYLVSLYSFIRYTFLIWNKARLRQCPTYYKSMDNIMGNFRTSGQVVFKAWFHWRYHSKPTKYVDPIWTNNLHQTSSSIFSNLVRA